jgi:Leucine-rich repeat (LRR) protein
MAIVRYVGLPQLSILLLNNNKINVLSNQVIQLKGLRTLDVSNNDLSDLPSEMALLPLLVRIQLEGIPPISL